MEKVINPADGTEIKTRSYAVCTTCLEKTNRLGHSKPGEVIQVECFVPKCRPGWCDSFDNEIDRDIRHLELVHGIKLKRVEG